jgi:hypothetical protein
MKLERVGLVSAHNQQNDPGLGPAAAKAAKRSGKEEKREFAGDQILTAADMALDRGKDLAGAAAVHLPGLGAITKGVQDTKKIVKAGRNISETNAQTQGSPEFRKETKAARRCAQQMQVTALTNAGADTVGEGAKATASAFLGPVAAPINAGVDLLTAGPNAGKNLLLENKHKEIAEGMGSMLKGENKEIAKGAMTRATTVTAKREYKSHIADTSNPERYILADMRGKDKEEAERIAKEHEVLEKQGLYDGAERPAAGPPPQLDGFDPFGLNADAELLSAARYSAGKEEKKR